MFVNLYSCPTYAHATWRRRQPGAAFAFSGTRAARTGSCARARVSWRPRPQRAQLATAPSCRPSCRAHAAAQPPTPRLHRAQLCCATAAPTVDRRTSRWRGPSQLHKTRPGVNQEPSGRGRGRVSRAGALTTASLAALHTTACPRPCIELIGSGDDRQRRWSAAQRCGNARCHHDGNATARALPSKKSSSTRSIHCLPASGRREATW